MRLSSIYHKVVLSSPHIEVMIRCFYWNNIKLLKKFRSVSSKSVEIEEKQKVDFNKVIDVLRTNGVMKDDIMVVHSSFGALHGTGLSVEEIIDKLYSLVNEGGSLAMPAIRSFEEELSHGDYLENYINNDMKGITTLYDVYKTPISSGLLPFTLMRYDDAEVSMFPLNPLVAIGVHAKEMMKNNVEGYLPSAHGSNSAWSYCVSHNAWNLGIGVDIKDYLTVFHVSQEVPSWPIKDWYFERDFIIKKSKREVNLRVNERKHMWTKYFAETNFYDDLLKSGVIKSYIIDGVPIYMTNSKELFDFISKQKNPTYPYYIPKKFRK